MTLTVTPDGVRYLHAARGDPVPAPFNLRWLIPRLCGQHVGRWRAAAIVGVALTAGSVAWMAPNWRAGVAAAALLLGLPSTRFNLTFPVLVDAPALGLATLSAALAYHHLWLPAILIAVVAGMVKETAPVFAAAFAFNPLLLVGLAAPLVRRLVAGEGPDVLDAKNAWILAHPFKAAYQFHSEQITQLDPILAAPWGACLVAAAHPSWHLALVVGLAYTQLCVATDTVRLYQWAAPTVCLAAVAAVPPVWWLVLILVTVFNPARGNGL